MPAFEKPPAPGDGATASGRIDKRIGELDDWRGKLLSQLRSVVRGADPDVVEEWKWETPVWSCAGIVCTGESYKKVVKLTFPKGASLADPAGLFNASLDGRVRRAIDFAEASTLDAVGLRTLVQAAIALNRLAADARPDRSRRSIRRQGKPGEP